MGLRDGLTLFYQSDYHAADVLTYFIGFLYLKTAGEQLLFQFFGFYIYIHIFF